MKLHKYNAQKTAIIFKGELVSFDSKAESLRAVELQRMEMAGLISELALQPSFELHPAFTTSEGKKIRAIKYVPDFSYYDELGRSIIEDTKGKETAEFKLKMKMFIFRYCSESDIYRISKRFRNSFAITDY